MSGTLSPNNTTSGLTLSRPSSPSRSLIVNETGLFERDVEFKSEHHFNAQEATDIAIPPVLQEAANVLTTEDPSIEIIRVASSSKIAGWQSPASDFNLSDGSPSPCPSRPMSFSNSSNARPSVSPLRDSDRHYFGATSPAYSSSPPETTILTPSTSPSPTPYDRYAKSSLPSAMHFPSAFGAEPQYAQIVHPAYRSGHSSPPEIMSPMALSPARATFAGSGTSENALSMHSVPSSPQHDSFEEVSATGKPRRLSFLSYADIINEERGDVDSVPSTVSIRPFASMSDIRPPGLAEATRGRSMR